MADDKNMELSDEMMRKAAGGEDDLDGYRTEPGTVVGPFEHYENNRYVVKRDAGPEAIASYSPSAGPLLEPGTRVMIALVGQGKWEIVEFL
ncbi:MAG: hypothetical protein K6E62_11600 [Lachnospiraceae bacterium]|nr:hypothetical protein [Lachnospiraceae bacterium]